jgi:hypothetical protein
MCGGKVRERMIDRSRVQVDRSAFQCSRVTQIDNN